jgi:ABC-type antimicrobial peptide transport system permease subunit
VGDTASVWLHSAYISVRLIGVVHYFPTMYEDPASLEAGFLVAPRDPLLLRLNNSNVKPINANEVWLSTDGQISADRVTEVVRAVDEIWETDAIQSTIKADPMALGLRSVTSYGYALTSLLSIVGFVTYFYMSARRREMSYGVLRSMGLSPWQLYASLVIEQVVLIVSGLALGTFLGAILNSLVLPGLPITLAKLPPVPPFRTYSDWAAVGRIYLVLGGVLLVGLSLATVLLWRARIHRVLRIGEE